MRSSDVLTRPDTTRAGPDERIVRRDLLRDAVFERLLTRILRLDYRRGQRLRLDGIATDMGVSRTPVREALVPLESLRLVSVQRYVGVVIAPWGVEDMVERLRIVQYMLGAPVSVPAARARQIACGPGAPLAYGDDHELDRVHDDGDESVERIGLLGPWEPGHIGRSASQAGVFAALSEWVLRQQGHPVSADWLAAQRPVLDRFYSKDVAPVHGIDVAAGSAERAELLTEAQAAAMVHDLRRATIALDAYADRTAEIGERFTHRRRS
jgi:Mn-dependent DtxR family transcriptional regulator